MENRSLKLLILLSSLIFFANAGLQAQNKLIAPKKLQKDFDNLKKVMQAHPDPFTHISEKDFNHKFDSIKQRLTVPLSIPEFYKKTAFMIALIKDGHTSVGLPKDWMKKKRKAVGALPLEFYLTNDDKLYVLKNYREKGIPVRAKITKINGVETQNFINIIDPFISYETKKFRNTRIDDNFEMYLYLVFGFSANTEFEYSTGEIKTLKVENMPYKEWKKIRKNDREERELKIAKGKPYDYKKISEGVGLINIYAFQTRDLISYDKFLNKTFKNIQKDNIHSLIIDIRGNYGGWPKIASKLFHYISDTHFKTMGKSSMKVSNTYRNNLLRMIPALRSGQNYVPQREHYVDINSIINNKLDSYVDEESFFNEKPTTEKYEFTGDCYLLTNRDSYSAASSFASTFQCYRMGVIIGEETGGTKIFRANAIYEVSPNSGLRVYMSTTKLFTACYNEELEGVAPTIEYKPSIFEITSGMDTHLLYTQKIIKKIQSQKQ